MSIDKLNKHFEFHNFYSKMSLIDDQIAYSYDVAEKERENRDSKLVRAPCKIAFSRDVEEIRQKKLQTLDYMIKL